MQINVTYVVDPNVAPPPAAFFTTVQYAVDILDAAFTNDVTMDVVVGWNLFKGHHVAGTGDDGINLYTPLTYSYSDIKAALFASATSPAQQAAYATLPAGDPSGGLPFELPSAEARALGLPIPVGTNTTDSWVGVNPNVNWSYDPSHAPGPGQVDLVGLIEHEITESMGRNSYLGTVSPDTGLAAFGIEDLFRYSASGVRELLPGAPASTGYFSIDDGATKLGVWNNDANAGDLGDWNTVPDYGGPGPHGQDSFDNNGAVHIYQPLTQTDLTLMQILGWDPSAPQNIVINGETYFIDATHPTVSGLTIEPGGTVDKGAGGQLTGGLSFDGPGGLFVLEAASAPNAVIKGFVAGDTIDFTGAPVGAHPTVTLLSGNVLEIVEHNTTYDFKFDPNQDFSGQTFHVTGDGQGGTLIFIDPSVQAVTTSGPGISNGSGDLNAGHTVTFNVTMNEAVDVDTTHGLPTLSLNDNGAATYSGGSGTNLLTFTYTVAAGENTADLAINAFNANSAIAQDANGHAADFSGAAVNPAGVLQIDTTPPQVTAIAGPGPGPAGPSWVFSFDEPVQATSGATVFNGALSVDPAATAALHDQTKLVFGSNTAPIPATSASYSEGVTDLAGNPALPGLAPTLPMLGGVVLNADDPHTQPNADAPAAHDFHLLV